MLGVLIVFVIAALPLVIGFVGGVVYAVARIVWFALMEGFASGSNLIERRRSD
jgi:hypothetical protein